jgi:hypothetical protein
MVPTGGGAAHDGNRLISHSGVTAFGEQGFVPIKGYRRKSVCDRCGFTVINREGGDGRHTDILYVGSYPMKLTKKEEFLSG